MTAPMKANPTYQALHARLVEEVRSAPVEADDAYDVAGQTIHCLLSAQAALCAMPDHVFDKDDRTDILNVIKNLGLLVRRI